MTQIDQVTQHNSTSAMQSAQAAEQLTALTSDVRSAIETLLHLVQGSGEITVKHLSQPSNVLPFRKEAKTGHDKLARTPKTYLKKAVGAEEIPTENDPRFEDA